MKQIFTLVFIILTLTLFSQTTPNFDKINKAVVVVLIYDFKGNLVGHGSGFIIDEKGTVITNYHVVEEAYSLKVRVAINGKKSDYEVSNIISGNKSIDLAKISIKNIYNAKFNFLSLGKIETKIGEKCWAIGTPSDIDYMNTVTEGNISNMYPNGIKIWKGKMLQVSAPFTHGSSGGALVNNKGEIIGVTCGGASDEDGARANINWAISISELNNLYTINKKSIVDPNKIPCQIGFYTNNPYTGNVYFYVDGVYIGTFSKYFQNSYTPTCGETGTITRYLYAGNHNYSIYYGESNQWYHGTINLGPGQCQIFRVGDTKKTYVNENYYTPPTQYSSDPNSGLAYLLLAVASPVLFANDMYFYPTYSFYSSSSKKSNYDYNPKKIIGLGYSFGFRKNFKNSSLEYGISNFNNRIFYSQSKLGFHVNYMHRIFLKNPSKYLKLSVGPTINSVEDIGFGVIIGNELKISNRFKFDFRYELSTQTNQIQLGVIYNFQKVSIL
jgi:hypothetical protein